MKQASPGDECNFFCHRFLFCVFRVFRGSIAWQAKGRKIDLKIKP
jgi:hypothetical protein